MAKRTKWEREKSYAPLRSYYCSRCKKIHRKGTGIHVQHSKYSLYSVYNENGKWVPGDWEGDGIPTLDTGVYAVKGFRRTSKKNAKLSARFNHYGTRIYFTYQNILKIDDPYGTSSIGDILYPVRTPAGYGTILVYIQDD